jgi:5-formyltetrahydrofolate cyclo-ligase
MKMQKVEARKIFAEKRKQLLPKEINIFQDLLLIRFQELDIPYCRILHTYLPMYNRNEPDPIPLADWMRFRDTGIRLAYPRINPVDMSMKHIVANDDTVFVLNPYGIPEPETGDEVEEREIDIVILPLLCFDNFGNRVGYGKGYYDRFLANCRQDVLKIGLSFFSPIESITDIDFFDKKLDLCITPERVYAF